jgi:hypothetical protein
MHLLAVVLFSCSVTLSAQEHSLRGDQAFPVLNFHEALLPVSSFEADYRLPFVFHQPAALSHPDGLTLNWLQSSAPPPKPSKTPPEKIKRTSIDPSMVGYIEDAIVTSEVRFRFDAAIHDDTPDRAEFFYAKCGCYRGLPAPTAANPTLPGDPNSPGPGTGIPNYVNFQQLYFYGEYAVVPKISVFTQIPVRFLQAKSTPGAPPGFTNNAGFGDMFFGVKYAPWMSPTHSLTFRFLLNAPTGNARNGLGTNHVSIEPSLLYYQQLSGRMAVEAEVGDTHPLSSSGANPLTAPYGFAGDVFFYGVGPSYRFINDEKFGLAGVLELVAWNVRSGQATGRTNTYGVNMANLKVGPRMSFGNRQSLYIGYGIALTSQNWYREIFRTEYRYTF